MERSSDDAQYSRRRRFFFFSGLSIIPPPPPPARRRYHTHTQPKWRRLPFSASVQLFRGFLGKWIGRSDRIHRHFFFLFFFFRLFPFPFASLSGDFFDNLGSFSRLAPYPAPLWLCLFIHIHREIGDAIPFRVPGN